MKPIDYKEPWIRTLHAAEAWHIWEDVDGITVHVADAGRQKIYVGRLVSGRLITAEGEHLVEDGRSTPVLENPTSGRILDGRMEVRAYRPTLASA